MDTLASASHRRIAGLDGVRGVAVALVLGFHLYPRLVPGGWLGVSLFFTLSGFLITTVILRDLDNNTFTFGSFYARRIRRLVPAALLVLAVFTLSWTVFGWFDTNHRTDVFFSMLQIANWQQIWEGIPYGTALASPVVHYWSLAIEEQAYVVLPLLIVLSGAKRLRLVAIALFGVAVVATFLANANQSVIYFGTHTRAAEILAGVIVAAFVHRTTKRPPQVLATIISSLGLTYLIAASLVVHLNDNIVYRGGLIATGVISAVVIATLPHSPLAKIFDLAPLVWLGTVSYGIYLIHWPVLQTLKRTDLPHWAISPLTLLATFILAAIMHRSFERPLRFSFSPKVAVSITTTILITTVLISTFAVRPPASFEDIEKDVTTDTTPRPIINAPRVIYFGDSKMALFYKSLQNRLTALDSAAMSDEQFGLGESFTRNGCPVGYLGFMMNGEKVQEVGEGCDWTVYDTGRDPSDIAVIWGGTWDTTDRKIEELFGDRWVNLDDDGYRNWITSEYEKLFAHLKQTRQVKVIAVVNYLGESMKERQATYSEFLRSFEQQGVIFLDLFDYLAEKEVKDFLPDGSHVSIGEPTEFSPSNDNSGADLYEKWFEPALCQAIQEKVPSLLAGVTCPTIDHSPRVKN